MAGLLTGIFAGRESLITHGAALSNIADNIANTSTTGYKNSRLEFGDIIADSIGSLYGAPLSSGNGVLADDQTTFHSIQGALDFTGRELDVAIQGRGYFILSDGASQKYTRAGNFVTDLEGNLQATSGEAVLGFTDESPDAPVPLSLATAGGDAAATTAVTLTGNLAADAPESIPGVFDNFTALNDATSFRNSLKIIDSLGAEQDVSLHFFKSGVGQYTVRAYVDSGVVGAAGAEPGTPTQVGEVVLNFDGNGQMTNPDAANLQVAANWNNGAAASAITVDLSGFVGFAGTSSVSSLNSDGVKAGDVDSIRFEQDGTVLAVLSNGEETPIGRIAIATFSSPNGLERIGSNNYVETPESGAPEIGLPAVEGRGTINGGALESSIVDPANEFVSMIRFQRGYQASSSVIQTLDRVLDQTIQIL
ncbi:MAG: flagellar hook protein FlgE [Bdellovibrionales bacterium]|nr:flagellar hook protein FlgE [Bdellovibrionales bacterium]